MVIMSGKRPASNRKRSGYWIFCQLLSYFPRLKEVTLVTHMNKANTVIFTSAETEKGDIYT